MFVELALLLKYPKELQEENVKNSISMIEIICIYLWWVELHPSKRYVEFLIPMPMNVTLFENRVFADVIKLR